MWKKMLCCASVVFAFGTTAALAETSDVPQTSWTQWVYRWGVAAMDAVDATPAQRRAMKDVGRRAYRRLAPHRAEVAEFGEQVVRVWTAPTVTRESVEEVRVDGVALADALSVEAADIVVDAAAVLTVSQRKTLVKEAYAQANRLWER